MDSSSLLQGTVNVLGSFGSLLLHDNLTSTDVESSRELYQNSVQVYDEQIEKLAKETMPPAEHTKDPIDPKIQSGVRKLPTELRDDILDRLLMMCLCPGQVIIDRRPIPCNSDTGFAQWCQPLDPSILGGLDQETTRKALKMMYGENEWIVGQYSGRVIETLMGRMSPSNRALIRSVHIKFSWRDSSFVQEDEETFVKRKMQIALAEGSTQTEMHFRARHWLNAFEAGSDLMLIWLAKIRPFWNLQLNHLTVDVRDAIDFQGHFKGLELVKQLRYPLYTSPKITVLAPTKKDEADVLEVLEDVTGPWFVPAQVEPDS